MPVQSEEAAAARARDFLKVEEGEDGPKILLGNFGDDDEAQPDEVVSAEPEAAAPEAQDAEPEPEPEAVLDLNPEVPEDILREIAEADIDDELAAEPEPEEDEQYEEYEDDESTQRKLRKAEKQLAWERKQRVQGEQAKWREEARKFFPLSDPDTIHAESRRAFRRAAKAQHDFVLPHVNQIKAQYEADREKQKADAVAEARNEAAEAWGKPTVSVGSPSAATGSQERPTTHEESLKQMFDQANMGR